VPRARVLVTTGSVIKRRFQSVSLTSLYRANNYYNIMHKRAPPSINETKNIKSNCTYSILKGNNRNKEIYYDNKLTIIENRCADVQFHRLPPTTNTIQYEYSTLKQTTIYLYLYSVLA